MNNLKKLRKELGLSTRKLSSYVDISYSVLAYLETGQRPFRQAHIDSLTAFFNVTSDYLLGRTNVGYIVKPEYGDEEITFSENEYNRLKEHISTTIIHTKPFNLEIESSKEITNVILPTYQIYRELKGKTENYDMEETVSLEYENIGKKLTEEEKRKAIQFIKEYILK